MARNLRPLDWMLEVVMSDDGDEFRLRYYDTDQAHTGRWNQGGSSS